VEERADSLFAIAQRANALQPAAEAVVHSCGVARTRPADEPVPKALTDDARRIAAGFRRLRDELERLRASGEDAEELARLLDGHGDVVTRALRIAAERGPDDPIFDGLGRSAARLTAVRDRLRRGTTVAGREVEDVPGF
jgi:hypothetical protein